MGLGTAAGGTARSATASNRECVEKVSERLAQFDSFNVIGSSGAAARIFAFFVSFGKQKCGDRIVGRDGVSAVAGNYLSICKSEA